MQRLLAMASLLLGRRLPGSTSTSTSNHSRSGEGGSGRAYQHSLFDDVARYCAAGPDHHLTASTADAATATQLLDTLRSLPGDLELLQRSEWPVGGDVMLSTGCQITARSPAAGAGGGAIDHVTATSLPCYPVFPAVNKDTLTLVDIDVETEVLFLKVNTCECGTPSSAFPRCP
jgi:hypothetical protein